MVISELIEKLEIIKESHGDIPVVGAYQPSWPFTESIDNICCLLSEEFGLTAVLALDGDQEYVSKSVFEHCEPDFIVNESEDED
jgi:hypothetical protein